MTSSHSKGQWNSWSRVPYITTIRTSRTGKPSIIRATMRIHNNFILANYFSSCEQQAIDTDDGSAYYQVYGNFFADGDNGLKSDSGGHDTVWHGNVLAYVGNCYEVFNFNFNFKGTCNDAFYDNTCVFRTGYGSTCGLATGFAVRNTSYTSVFSESGNLTVCKIKTKRPTGQTGQRQRPATPPTPRSRNDGRRMQQPLRACACV